MAMINKPGDPQISRTQLDSTEKETPVVSADKTKQFTGFSLLDQVEVHDPNIAAIFTLQSDQNIVSSTVNFLLEQAGSSAPNGEAMAASLQNLSPEDRKAVLQSLIDSGKLDNMLDAMARGSNPQQVGEFLASLMRDAQSDPEMIAILEKALQGQYGSVLSAFVEAAGNDPELLKALPEETLVSLLEGVREDSEAWKAVYDSIQLKGPSHATTAVIIHDTVNSLIDATYSDDTAMFDHLRDLSPEDRKAVIQELMDRGEFESVLNHLTAGGRGNIEEMTEFLAALLQDAQSDPDLLSILNQTLQFPAATEGGAIVLFVQSTGNNPEVLSQLSEDTLLVMLDHLPNASAEWSAVYDAINL